MNEAHEVSASAIQIRRNATKIMENAHESGCSSVDLSRVEFVSRSVADELIHRSKMYDIELIGLEGDVKTMISAVSGQLKQTAD